MKCVICRTGSTRAGLGTMTFVEGACTVVVKEIPAEVCSTCGEEYFDEATSRRLVEIAKEAASSGVEVDVRRYHAA